jgi:hypothetical protein
MATAKSLLPPEKVGPTLTTRDILRGVPHLSPESEPMTTQEVEEIKSHFDKVVQDIRAEFRTEVTRVRAELRDKITGVDRHANFMIESLSERIAAARDHAKFLHDALTSEVRIRDCDVRAELRRPRESNDALRRRIDMLHDSDSLPAAASSPVPAASGSLDLRE